MKTSICKTVALMVFFVTICIWSKKKRPSQVRFRSYSKRHTYIRAVVSHVV